MCCVVKCKIKFCILRIQQIQQNRIDYYYYRNPETNNILSLHEQTDHHSDASSHLCHFGIEVWVCNKVSNRETPFWAPFKATPQNT